MVAVMLLDVRSLLHCQPARRPFWGGQGASLCIVRLLLEHLVRATEETRSQMCCQAGSPLESNQQSGKDCHLFAIITCRKMVDMQRPERGQFPERSSSVGRDLVEGIGTGRA